jgi:hypothetical protein
VKYNKPSLTYSEQVKCLASRGLIIEIAKEAEHFLAEGYIFFDWRYFDEGDPHEHAYKLVLIKYTPETDEEYNLRNYANIGAWYLLLHSQLERSISEEEAEKELTAFHAGKEYEEDC